MTEERQGLRGTIAGGVFFTEHVSESARVIRHIHVEISRQNSNLTEIKAKMALEAKAAGASAIMGFRYGQKKHEWWEQVLTFKWDTESWHGEGDATIL